jgi:hypothetical protein
MKPFGYSLRILWCLFYFAKFTKAQVDGTLKDILAPIVNLLECDKGTPEIQQLCQLVTAKIRPQLAAAGLTIEKNDILFNYDDPTSKDIDTGHSCTVTAAIKDTRASALLSDRASLDLSGNPLSGQGVVAVSLPVSLSAAVDIQEKFGVNIWPFGCNRLGSDTFTVSGSISTTAAIWIYFTLAPSLRPDTNGDYILTIHPLLDVTAKLANTQITSTHISGASPFAAIATAVLAFPSDGLKAFTDLIRGDFAGAWDQLFQQFPKDLAIGAISALPSPVLNAILPYLAKAAVASKLKGVDSRFSAQLKNKLTAAIAKTLSLDANGEHNFVVKKNFASLLQQNAQADVFLPSKAVGYCAFDADCDDGKYCTGVEKCVQNVCVKGSYPCEASDQDWTVTCNEAAKNCVTRPKITCRFGTKKICP